MKTILLQFFLLLIIPLFTKAQTQFTPYDELPGIDKTIKPAYSDSYMGWQKMLYQYPVNYHQIRNDFERYSNLHPNEKSALVRYYKIWSRVITDYTNADGEIAIQHPDEWQNKLYEQQTAQNNLLKSTHAGNTGWRFLGPVETTWLNDPNISSDRIGENGHPKQCPWQVNVYSFDVAATNENIIYCGTETGYVNKSTDKGLSWEPLGLSYPFGGGITAVAIHPNSPDTVYVAAGKQLHKTTDGGVTWTPLLSLNSLFSASRLKIDTNNPNKIIAAAAEGIFISTTGGAVWQKKWSYPTYDVDIKPNNSEVIYGLSKNSSGKYTLAISTNGGSNFSVQENFPSAITESSGGLLAVTADNQDALFAVMLSSDEDETPYLYKGTITNNEWNWVKLAKGKTPALEMNNGQGYFDLVLEVAPKNENIIFVGTTTLYKSTNGGSGFTKVGGYGGDFDIHPDIQDMKILENGEMWVSTDGGMNFSTDYFSAVENYSSRSYGILGSDMWGFDQGWNEDIIVGGRYHNGNTALTDFYDGKALRMGGAESPTGWVIKGKSRHVAFNDLGNGWILPDKSDGFAEGRFIFSKYPNMDEYGGRRGNLVQHPNYYGTIYLGEENGFWRSTDMGQSFDLLHQFPGRVRYLQISPVNPNLLFADIVNYGLYKSADGGISWERKPTLTNGTYADASWNGKLFFVLSPTDENKIYVCLQNGTWSNDIGKIFRSDDGGDTWTNWTNGLQAYTKSLVIQPAQNGKDLIYLFTTSRNGESAKVYSRYEEQPYWVYFSENYPAGISVNSALPFYRDSKIRMAGNAGIWEVEMVDTTFTPLINPWIEKAFYSCMEDTLYFDDHSILNHSGATWEWSILPEPVYIDDVNKRNPKVVLGNPGSYDVTLTVTVNGEAYSKTIPNMVETTTCPSLSDCSNPGILDKSLWSFIYADSEETAGENGNAVNAFDEDPTTIWHTEWYYSNPGYPHEIQIDLGDTFNLSGLKYLPRQNSANGRIKDYEIYISDSRSNWGSPVTTGSFDGGANEKNINFEATTGRYLRFRALTEQNGNNWASIAEIALTGCYHKDNVTSVIENDFNNMINVFPVPCNDKLSIDFPGNINGKWNYNIYSGTGNKVDEQHNLPASSQSINVTHLSPGMYYLFISNDTQQTFRVKFIKN